MADTTAWSQGEQTQASDALQQSKAHVLVGESKPQQEKDFSVRAIVPLFATSHALRPISRSSSSEKERQAAETLNCTTNSTNSDAMYCRVS